MDACTTKPPPSVAALLDCIQTQDLDTTEGRQVLWRALARLGAVGKQHFERYRDEYLKQGFPSSEANRMAANDVAREEGSARKTPESRNTGNAPHQNQFDLLMSDVRELKKGSHCGIGPSVTWVSANLRTRMEDIDPEGVPGCEALSMWLWASQNETEYRRLYDSKRIPSRGIAEDDRAGFVDDGKAILDIMDRIRDGIAGALSAGETNVSMRHLQAEEPNGNDHQPQGRVHDLPVGAA